jgi:hypothetical protein
LMSRLLAESIDFKTTLVRGNINVNTGLFC